MKTEAKAALMWCPMVRAVGDGTSGDNAYLKPTGEVERNPHYARCIGSQCAMWRWSPDPVRTVGYCGFAGQPVRVA